VRTRRDSKFVVGENVVLFPSARRSDRFASLAQCGAAGGIGWLAAAVAELSSKAWGVGWVAAPAAGGAGGAGTAGVFSKAAFAAKVKALCRRAGTTALA
jgi:hypothetical protein